MAETSRILHEARRAMGWTQRDLARSLGVSTRTGERWDAGRTSPAAEELLRLARIVHPRDAAVAQRIANHAREMNARSGLATPPLFPLEAAPPAPPPLTERPLPLARRVDIVVCAAAAALDVSPRVVKPAVLEAFRAAAEIGLGASEVVAALEPVRAPRPRRPRPGPRRA
jgi:transcriptional regulator with XRE-family HTH domain